MNRIQIDKEVVTKALLIAIPFITFSIGLLLPSPLSKVNEESSDEIAHSDTIMDMNNGSRYEGRIISGTKIRDGFGTLTFKGGTVYEGEWKDDKLRYGTKKNDFSTYKGHFNDDLQNNGFGIIEYSDKYVDGKISENYKPQQIVIRYTGNWADDKKNGLGRSFKADGSIEFGMYKDGLLVEGKGLTNVEDKVYGIDVSHYQRNIDWDNLAFYSTHDANVLYKKQQDSYLQPISFVYLKATEGATIRDNLYSVRAIEADRHGIAKGAYHFLHLQSNINEQVKNFIETVSWIKGDLPPALDIECEKEIREKGEDKLIDYAIIWLTEIERHFDVKPIIYTTENIQERLLRDTRISQYKFWIAKPEKAPSSPWLMWQQSHSGNVRGCDGIVDINKFNGDYAKFEKYLNP